MSLKSWLGSLSKWSKLSAPSVEPATSIKESEVKIPASDSTEKGFTEGITETLEILAAKADPQLEIKYDTSLCRYIAKDRLSGKELGYLNVSTLIKAVHPQDIVAEFINQSKRELWHRFGSPKASSVAKTFVLPTGPRTSVVIQNGETNWALLRKDEIGYMVQIPSGSFRTDNILDAMLYIANFYGVDLDEDSDSKK